MPQRRIGRTTRCPRGVVIAGLAALASASAAAPAAAETATFSYTGAQQKFVVPAGVTSVHVRAVGGAGGKGFGPGGGAAGAPAEASGDLEVLPGQTLYVEVGGTGSEAVASSTVFGGGAIGGLGSGSGGGASDVRLLAEPVPDTTASLFSRLIVAGGGGGGGSGNGPTTGGGGGPAGGAGGHASGAKGEGGGGASEEAGGVGCGGFCDGTLGSGDQGSQIKEGVKGGAGGGGLFGGAGGEANGQEENGGGGGGGGSSLAPAGGTTVVPAVVTAPQVQISYVPPPAPIGPRTGPAPSRGPSNIFALLPPVVGADGSITLVLDLEGPGTVKASATGSRTETVKKHGRRIHRKVRFTYGRAAVTRQEGGVLELTIKPSLTGRKALKAAKRLPLAIAVTFAPVGADPLTKHVSVTLTRH